MTVSNLPHRYGNSHAVWDHTMLPATRQSWHSRPYPNRRGALQRNATVTNRKYGACGRKYSIYAARIDLVNASSGLGHSRRPARHTHAVCCSTTWWRRPIDVFGRRLSSVSLESIVCYCLIGTRLRTVSARPPTPPRFMTIMTSALYQIASKTTIRQTSNNILLRRWKKL